MSPLNSAQLEANLAFPVKRLIKRPPLFIDPSATIRQAAQAMQTAGVGSVLIAAEPPAIVTDRDLRGRALAKGLGPETPITQIMSRPLKTVDATAPALAALRLMIEENIHHLPVLEEGIIIGVISGTDLLLHQASNPIYLRGVIDKLEKGKNLARYAAEIAALVAALFHGGLGAAPISRIVATLNDALVKRLVALAQSDLGPPPANYAWIVFGSEGRLEQTLLTDQDNALIYADSPSEAHAYFAELARRVVEGLIEAGFPPCPGGFMATNWCKPLAEWQRLYTKWIRLPEPEALLDAAIFFDFRAVAGTLSLASLEEIITGAAGEKLFIAHMLNGALAFRPPLGFFNRLRHEKGKIDVKRVGLAPIVGLARAAALAAGSRERSTVERLSVAGASGAVLDRESAQALAEMFPHLLYLRLCAQLAARENNQPTDNSINLAEISPLERRRLKDAFTVIKRIQESLRTVWQLDRLG
jgi:CBS domain-containing protein